MSPSSEPSGSGQVTGVVLSGHLPVAEAIVMIVEGHSPHPDIAAMTDEHGRFQLGGLSAGWYNLEARLGDRTARHSVELHGSEHVDVRFELTGG